MQIFLLRSILRRLNPLSISAWQVNNEISLHVSVQSKVTFIQFDNVNVACIV